MSLRTQPPGQPVYVFYIIAYLRGISKRQIFRRARSLKLTAALKIFFLKPGMLFTYAFITAEPCGAAHATVRLRLRRLPRFIECSGRKEVRFPFSPQDTAGASGCRRMIIVRIFHGRKE